MLASPPNRQSVPKAIHGCDRTHLLVQSAGVLAAFAVLVAMSERSWSQSAAPARAPLAPVPVEKLSSASETQSQQNAIRFIARNTPIVKPKATAPTEPKAAVKPIDTPPLAIAD